MARSAECRFHSAQKSELSSHQMAGLSGRYCWRCSPVLSLVLGRKCLSIPSPLRYGKFRWTGFFIYSLVLLVYGYKFFTEYTAIDVLKYSSAPGPFEDRGIRPDGGRWLGLQPAVRRTSDAVPSSLYRHSQRSCRPQPRRGGGDATSRQVTRQDC